MSYFSKCLVFCIVFINPPIYLRLEPTQKCRTHFLKNMLPSPPDLRGQRPKKPLIYNFTLTKSLQNLFINLCVQFSGYYFSAIVFWYSVNVKKVSQNTYYATPKIPVLSHLSEIRIFGGSKFSMF